MGLGDRRSRAGGCIELPPGPRNSLIGPLTVGVASERPSGNRKKFISGCASPKPISDLYSGLKQQVA